MPKVLEREKTTFKGTVEAPERRDFREFQPPPHKEIGPVRWIAWVVALMTVVLAGVFVKDMVGDGGSDAITSDGSFETNELARMQTLASDLDESFEVNEMARFLRLAPEGPTG